MAEIEDIVFNLKSYVRSLSFYLNKENLKLEIDYNSKMNNIRILEVEKKKI